MQLLSLFIPQKPTHFATWSLTLQTHFRQSKCWFILCVFQF